MRRIPSFLSLAGAGLALYAVVALQACRERGAQAETRLYVCSDGVKFRVDLTGGEAIATLRGRTIRLEQRPAASGVKYAGGGVMFWTKGRTAMLEVEGEPRRNCEVER